MSNIRSVNLNDATGNPISSTSGALAVQDPQVYTQIVNQGFHQDSAVTTTLTAQAVAGSTTLSFTSAVGFAVGSFIEIDNTATGDSESHHPIITAIVGTVITLDSPLDRTYEIGDIVTLAIHNLNVVASIGAAESFYIAPHTGDKWHLTRILIEMTMDTAGDNALFGDLPSLTNGIALRKYDGTTGLFNTFTVWKNNGDIATDVYDVSYIARSDNAGSFGINIRGTFTRSGGIVELDGTAGDYIEVLVQDDLSGLISFKAKCQGHFVI